MLAPDMTCHVVAASVRGKTHLQQGKGNQDAYCLASHLNGSLLLAVADGAGSALWGGEGAALATTSVITFLSQVDYPENEASWHSIMLEAFQHVHTTLEAHGSSQQKESRDFACTLLVAVLTSYHLIAAQVGDGAIVGINEIAERLTKGVSGEYAGETVFITSAHYLEYVSCVTKPIDTFQGIALLTDGLESVATHIQTGEAFSPFFRPLLPFAKHDNAYERSQSLEAFLAGERLTQRSHDDKTLVLVVPS